MKLRVSRPPIHFQRDHPPPRAPQQCAGRCANRPPSARSTPQPRPCLRCHPEREKGRLPLGRNLIRADLYPAGNTLGTSPCGPTIGVETVGEAERPARVRALDVRSDAAALRHSSAHTRLE
eukprot:21555-Rhodomonas_salina.3